MRWITSGSWILQTRASPPLTVFAIFARDAGPKASGGSVRSSGAMTLYIPRRTGNLQITCTCYVRSSGERSCSKPDYGVRKSTGTGKTTTDDLYLLAETLHVRGFSEPEFQEDLINGLVMDSRRKSALKALAKSFARRNRFDEVLEKSMWSADFVRGKGSGLIFLLHGVPGVGKTCTAGITSSYPVFIYSVKNSRD